MPRSHIRHSLQLLGAALLFSTAGAAIKACALTSWQVAGFRAAIAAVALALFVPEARRRWTWRTALVGLAYAATVILFVRANKLTTAASAIFLQSTAPLYIVLLGPWLLKEPVHRRDVAFLVALAAGLALFFIGIDPPASTAPDTRQGNVVAAVSAFTCGLMLVGLRGLGRSGSVEGTAAPAVLLGNLIAAVVVLPWALPLGDVRPLDWIILVYLGVFQIGLAYTLLLAGLREVPVLEAALLLSVEPVLNPVWAWLVHGERPGVWSLAGGGLILAATAVRAGLEARREGALRDADGRSRPGRG